MPLAGFSDSHLRSDFFLLEGAQRTREAARRFTLKDTSRAASHSQPHDLIREARPASSAVLMLQTQRTRMLTCACCAGSEKRRRPARAAAGHESAPGK